MNALEFNTLSKELIDLAPSIPLSWGKIQNNTTDNKFNLFSCKTIQDLEVKIALLSDADKNYFRRRWFLWQCSRCDEYLFYINDEVTRNPNSKDQNYDIEFYNNLDLRFDVKGTLVPKELRSNFSLQHPEKICKTVSLLCIILLKRLKELWNYDVLGIINALFTERLFIDLKQIKNL